MFLPMGIYLLYYIKNINKVGGFTFTIIKLLFVMEVIQLEEEDRNYDFEQSINLKSIDINNISIFEKTLLVIRK
jgi:hypothetical protein